MLYLVSYFQNPTGVTTSFEKKCAILKLLKKFERAAGHPIYLLEDAAYRELRFSGRDVPSALTVRGAADRVIYAGTFSKPFATGARVGYGILPEPVFHRREAHQGQSRFRHGESVATTLRPDADLGNLRQARCPAAKALRAQGARDETGARKTFPGRRRMVGAGRRTVFLGAAARAIFQRA